MGIGEVLIVLLLVYLMLMYIVIMITVIVDVLRSHDLSGAKKAFWVIALMLLPIVMLIVYLFSRGDGLRPAVPGDRLAPHPRTLTRRFERAATACPGLRTGRAARGRRRR